jgi:drug/metabolite transporter (DMT)-like permease
MACVSDFAACISAYLSATQFAVVLAFLSALLLSLSDHIQHAALAKGNAQTGTLIAIIAGGCLFWALAPWLLLQGAWMTRAAVVFVLVGLVRPAFTLRLGMIGIQHLGPSLNGALIQTSPLFTAALAALVLGEALTLNVVVGTVAVCAAVVIAATKPIGPTYGMLKWAVMIPLGAAAIRALCHISTKYGLAEVASPFFAALVGYTVSSLVACGSFRPTPNGQRCSPRSIFGFVGVGVMTAIALLSLNSAIHLADLSVVIPLASLGPVITLALSAAVFRREALTWRVFATVALAALGTVLVALR